MQLAHFVLVAILTSQVLTNENDVKRSSSSNNANVNKNVNSNVNFNSQSPAFAPYQNPPQQTSAPSVAANQQDNGARAAYEDVPSAQTQAQGTGFDSTQLNSNSNVNSNINENYNQNSLVSAVNPISYQPSEPYASHGKNYYNQNDFNFAKQNQGQGYIILPYSYRMNGQIDNAQSAQSSQHSSRQNAQQSISSGISYQVPQYNQLGYGSNGNTHNSVPYSNYAISNPGGYGYYSQPTSGNYEYSPYGYGYSPYGYGYSPYDYGYQHSYEQPFKSFGQYRIPYRNSYGSQYGYHSRYQPEMEIRQGGGGEGGILPNKCTC